MVNQLQTFIFAQPGNFQEVIKDPLNQTGNIFCNFLHMEV